MKKLTLLALVLASSACIKGYAQDDDRDEFKFGLKAGLNLSNVYDAQGEQFDADPKLGFVAGATFAIPLGELIGVQPEILISQKGFKANGSLFGSPYSFTRTTTYIDVPLQFAFKPSQFFTILVGPQYSYLIHRRDVFANASTSVAQEEEFQNENLRKNLFGFVGGFDVNIKPIVIAAKLGWDVTKNNGDGTSTTPRYKNVWYQLAVGVRF